MIRLRLPLLLLVASLATACSGPKAVRGGPGTDRPDLDRAALSTGLDREDLNYPFQENIDRLLASRAWMDFRRLPQRPLVALWAIINGTSQHFGSPLHTPPSPPESR